MQTFNAGYCYKWVTSLLLIALVQIAPAQSLLREVWLGVDGASIEDLTGHPNYPSFPSERSYPALFEGPVNWGDNYGTRFRGYLVPPATGQYTFWIASDNQSHLYLSTNELPDGKRLIAQVLNYTGSREWTKETNQQSAIISLVSGQRYYVEVLHVEGSGGDNIAVGWQLPDGSLERPVAGQHLSPWVISSNVPAITKQPVSLFVMEYQPAAFTVMASGDEPLRFQWYRDGALLDGETTATLLFNRATFEDSGTSYQCVIANPFGSVTSQVAMLTVVPDVSPPAVLQTHPASNTIVRILTQAEVYFSKPVWGVKAGDLLVNGQAAQTVSGVGAGPYRFTFPVPANGRVVFTWAATQNIRDYSANSNRLFGASWSVTLNPDSPQEQVIINEFVANNENGLLDEDGQAEGWIELFNRGTNSVDLTGWSLSDDGQEPNRWRLPNRLLAPGEYWIVFASGKDRRPTGGTNYSHTNFKLSGGGEYLGLFNQDSPRQAVTELTPAYPEQRNDIAYGQDAAGQWRYYLQPSPGLANTGLTATGMVSAPTFSAQRGFFSAPFNLQLACDTPGATIVYTTDGSPPSVYNGIPCTGKIPINQTRLIRAIAIKPGSLPSRIITHTFLMGQSAALSSLPVLSLVTAEYNLTGPNGIIGMNGGTYSNGIWQGTAPGDYFNPTNHGIAWERPVSAEFIRPADNSGFQVDCGLRVQGSPHIRPRYTPTSKFSYRLYFRGDYGAGRLKYPLFGDSPVQSFNQLVLRAGKNDITNPFIKDELVRRLGIDMGQVHVRGNFVNLFVNGVYKGYYNPTERNEEGFFQEWYGGEDWDVITVGREAQDGDNLDFNAMRAFISGNNVTNVVNYATATRWLDMTNFVDYLLVNIYGATRDWPHNNWRAARERRTGALWRFFVWDAEGAFGTWSQPPTEDTFTNALISGTAEIPRIYQALVKNQEFRLLFADRIHKHYFNDGAVTDSNVLAHFTGMKNELAGVIPSMNTSIQTAWVPQRLAATFTHFPLYDLAAYTNAPHFSQHGGRVSRSFYLGMSTTAGSIYYTTNGNDPRIPFTGEVAPDALLFTNPFAMTQSLPIRARALHNGKWSALTAADFQVGALGLPLRFSEIMHSPAGGGAYEFLELHNPGQTPIELSDMTFSGIEFKFLPGTWMAPGERLVLASDQSPNDFMARYPGVLVAGWFSGNLRNEGERLEIRDRNGRLVESVTYGSKNGWPATAAGGGSSIELLDYESDADSPASWRPSALPGGTPGTAPLIPPATVRLNELMADNAGSVTNGANLPDWVELYNPGPAAANLAGWRLSDAGTNGFVFPAGTAIGARQFLVIWMDQATNDPGLHAGFALSRAGDTLFLENAASNRVDALAFGAQLPDLSLGLDAADNWRLSQPTPGASNQWVATAATTNLFINEFLANALPGEDDWVELHNRHPNLPVALRGIYLGTSNNLHQIRSHAFIAPGGFIQLRADEKPGAQHLNFKLPASGGAITLFDDSGFLTMKTIYGAQAENVSRGSLPDGSTNQVNFTASQSPGYPNYLTVPSGVQIHEVMARNLAFRTNAAGNFADWIELRNTNTQPVALAGMSLCLNGPGKNRWYFPADTLIGATNLLIVWCDLLVAASTNHSDFLNTGHGLESESGGVYLYAADGRVTDAVEFGFQPANSSLGRVGAAWRLLATPTPGATNATAATLALPSNLRLNEWLANPLPGEEDWIEIYNLSTQPVELSGLGLTDDPSIAGRFDYVFPPLSFIAPNGFIQIIADGAPANGPNHAAFAVAAQGETLRLYQTNGVILDTVDTTLTLPGYAEGRCTDGGGQFCYTSVLTPGAPNVIFFPLTIFQQPTDLTVTNGNTFAFSVAAQGSGSLRYQWYQNDQALAAGTNALLSLGNAGSNHIGQYWVRITDDLNAMDSQRANLTVLFRPAIVIQPPNYLAAAGSNVTFEVTATGTAPMYYRWRRVITYFATNADLPSLTLANVQASNATFYSVTLANVAGAGVASRLFYLGVITNMPASQLLPPGTNVTLRVGAASPLALSYQWLFNGQSLPGATNAALVLTNFDSGQAGAYAAMVTMTNLTAPFTTPPAWLHLPRPLMLDGMPIRTEDGMRLTLDAYEGFQYAVESSPDLQQWSACLTITHTNGPLNLPWATNATQSFYRLRLISP